MAIFSCGNFDGVVAGGVMGVATLDMLDASMCKRQSCRETQTQLVLISSHELCFGKELLAKNREKCFCGGPLGVRRFSAVFYPVME
jgi:hypothetical protein